MRSVVIIADAIALVLLSVNWCLPSIRSMFDYSDYLVFVARSRQSVLLPWIV